MSPVEYISKNQQTYKDIVDNVTKNHPLSDDLYQEVILILCEYDPRKLQKIHDDGKLKWFFIRIVCNQWHSSSSPFFYKFKKNDTASLVDFDPETDDKSTYLQGAIDNPNGYYNLNQHIEEMEEYFDRMDENTLHKYIYEEVTKHDEEGKFPYDAELLKLYLKFKKDKKGMRHIKKATGISLTAVHSSVNISKKNIKKRFDEGLL